MAGKWKIEELLVLGAANQEAVAQRALLRLDTVLLRDSGSIGSFGFVCPIIGEVCDRRDDGDRRGGFPNETKQTDCEGDHR